MNAPQNPWSSPAFIARAEPFAVLIGAEGGAAVATNDETDDAQLALIMRSAGGRQLDVAEIAYSLAKTGERLVDLETPTEFSRKVQVRLRRDDDEIAPVLLFSGELATQAIKISKAEGERVHLQARVEPWHFGEPLLGPHVGDQAGDVQVPDAPIRFNPLIDGEIKFNRSTALNSDEEPAEGEPDNRYWLWLDPESVRTPEAIHYAQDDEDAGEWTLAQAVHALCWAANPDEPMISNPTLSECAMAFADAPEVKNIELPRGKYLPELLDALLQPFGYSWFLSPGFTNEEEDTEADYIGTNYLRFFKLGAGPETEVFLQRPGEELDGALSHVADLNVTWNIADVANVIVGQGSQKEIELTVELYRAWPEADDSLTADDLIRVDGAADDDAAIYSLFKEKRNVWRKWVLNEAGDYCMTRNGVAPILNTPFDLTEILGPASVPKRRKFGRRLGKDVDGDRLPPYIEYRDPAVAEDDDPGAWKPLDSDALQIQERPEILDRECGIYFGGSKPPAALIELGEDARLRITATIKADDRLTYESPRAAISPNGNEIRLVVDLSDRFHFRQFCTVAEFASQFAADTDDTAEADDTAALEAFCDALRDVEQAARLNCDFTLFGIHSQYAIGQLVTKVDGRNIQLNRNASDSPTKLYPQITGIRLDRTNQTTTLKVDTFDLPANSLRKLQF